MFLIDTNVLIEAKNLYYAFGIAPGYWEWLEEAHGAGDLASIPAVRDELLQQEDELSARARRQPDSFWLEETAETVQALQRLAHWAMTEAPRYSQLARTDFLASADYRLIAESLAGSHTVVTREQPAPMALKRILIPDACVAHAVSWASPFDVYGALGLRLVLSS
jgi:hypothetical protein